MWTWPRAPPDEALRGGFEIFVRIIRLKAIGQTFIEKPPRSQSFVFFCVAFHSQTHSFNYHQSFSRVLDSVSASGGSSSREARSRPARVLYFVWFPNACLQASPSSDEVST